MSLKVLLIQINLISHSRSDFELSINELSKFSFSHSDVENPDSRKEEIKKCEEYHLEGCPEIHFTGKMAIEEYRE